MTPATQTLDLHAPALGRDYRITLQPPASGAEPRAGLFVLDGNIYQPVMAQMTLLRSMGDEIVPVLVVGIGYPEDDPGAWMSRRTLDLTPCAPSQPMPHDSPDLADWGGLDRFLDFIDEQVQPRVREAYPLAAAHRVLFGHSLGGLAVTRALLRRPASYEGWFAVSPSVWWENRMVLQDVAAWSEAARERPGMPPRVFIATGGLEETPPERLSPRLVEMGVTPEQETALIAQARMIGNTHDLAAALAPTLQRLGGEVTCRIYEGETHMSIVPACLTAAFDLHFRPPAEPAGP
ncbi:MAG: alpha/beta hydrolase [Pseudomonadota bacterium]